MKILRARLFIFALMMVLAMPALLAGCARKYEIFHTTGKVFGTQIEISIYGESKEQADALGAQVLAEFDRMHHKFHAWQPGMLTALNEAIASGEPFQADAEMVDLLKSATALSERSDRLFNPAIGHLIRLWGFQSSEITPHDPPTEEIQHWVKADPRMSDLRYDGTTITSTNRAVMIDLGGYAKGYALDRAALILRGAHVKAALVNIGGNILAIGQPGDRPWKIGIRDPRGNGSAGAVGSTNTIATLDLHDNEAIGTSGDDQRYFMKEGKRHPHIIDPRTGQTTDTVAAVTIIASGGENVGLRSDGNSKPLFIAGPAHWREMAARLELDQVLLVDAAHHIEMTPAMQARLDAGQLAEKK